MLLYKKVEINDTVKFIPVDVPTKLTEYFNTFILKDKMIEDLALYLAHNTSGKSYKEIANEIVNLIFIQEK